LEQQPKANGQQKDGQRQADDNDLEVCLYWNKTQTNPVRTKLKRESWGKGDICIMTFGDAIFILFMEY
jgi:hypothetical protein